MAKDEGNNAEEEQSGSSEDAIEVEGSAADPLLNGTARTGTVVRIHGLANELRRLNFEKVGVLV